MDSGLGRLETFLAESTSFLSGKEVGFGMEAKIMKISEKGPGWGHSESNHGSEVLASEHLPL